MADWIVAGHSWGASLALLYCLTYASRARALIYLSGTGVDPAWRTAYRAAKASRLGDDGQQRLDALQARQSRATGAEYDALEREICTIIWATDFGDAELAHERARQLFVDDLLPNYEVNRQLGADENCWIEDVATPERLRDLRLPTLIAHGEADPRPVWAAQHLGRCLPGAVVRTIPGAGHLPWLEQPERLATILRELVADLSRWPGHL